MLISSFFLARTRAWMVGALLSILLFGGTNVTEAATCTIARDLELGTVGEDVRCLQKWLNSNGFLIAATGPGSLGNETGEYKTLTEAAVRRWQEANGVPATGFFGPRSRAVMLQGLVAARPSTNNNPPPMVAGESTTNPTILALVQTLVAKLEAFEKRLVALERGALESTSAVLQSTLPATQSNATKVLADTERALARVWDDVDDSRASSGNRKDAETQLQRARNALDKADDALYSRDYTESIRQSEIAQKLITEAGRLLEGVTARSSNDSRLTSQLRSLVEQYDELFDEVDTAVRNGRSVGAAQRLLRSADDLLSRATSAVDDNNRTRATGIFNQIAAVFDDIRSEL